MKICLINNLYKPYYRGGAERIVKLIADGLQEAGHEIFIITTKPYGMRQKVGSRQQTICYISALYYNLNVLPKLLRLLWHFIDIFDISNYWKIKTILKKEKPNVIMTHNLKGISYLIPILIKKLKIKHIHTLHDIQLLHPSGLMIYGKEQQIKNIFSKIYSNICKSLFNSPAIVVSPSNWLMDMHTDKNFFKKSKKIIIPNPTPTTEKEIVKDEQDNKIFKFLYVGQIEDHKGVLFLIKVLKKIDKKSIFQDCELTIAGSGQKMKQAQKIIGNNKNIKLLGQKTGQEIKKLMRSADCLIVPSLCYENSPTVIYEALNASLPVIAPRIGGITELIHNTSGILFKPGNGGNLMYQMKWAIEHKKKLQKTKEKGRKKIQQFNVENYIKKIIN